MRKEEEIRKKFRDLYFRDLARMKEEYLSKDYINCKYNIRNRVKDIGIVGFCINEEVTKSVSRNHFVCSNKYVCENCNHYECKNTEAIVEEKFNEILKNPVNCWKQYPRLAALIWVLYDDVPDVKNGFWDKVRKIF